MLLQNSLSVRVKASDEDGDISVLASFSSIDDAWLYYDYKSAELRNELGKQPDLWIEEFVTDQWVVLAKEEVEVSKKEDFEALEYGQYQPTLLHRRLTDGERDVLLNALKVQIDSFTSSEWFDVKQTIVEMFDNIQDTNFDGLLLTKERLNKFLLHPWTSLEKMSNLYTFLKGRSIIVETHLTIAEQF